MPNFENGAGNGLESKVNRSKINRNRNIAGYLISPVVSKEKAIALPLLDVGMIANGFLIMTILALFAYCIICGNRLSVLGYSLRNANEVFSKVSDSNASLVSQNAQSHDAKRLMDYAFSKNMVKSDQKVAVYGQKGVALR